MLKWGGYRQVLHQDAGRVTLRSKPCKILHTPGKGQCIAKLYDFT